MTATADLALADAALLLERGSLSAVEVAESCLARIAEQDPLLGATVTVDAEGALRRARASDRRRARGESLGVLDGIPIGVKDIIAVEGFPLRAQTRAGVEPQWRESGDATAVGALRAGGANPTATLATMEFAIGMPEPDGPFRVPANPTRWSGGSSSGSGTAVAVGMVLGALGTDTGGSIRTPAAFTGITGFKPGRGVIPTAGVFPLSPALDTVGPMARTAQDCALMFDVMRAAAPAPLRRRDLRGIRIGVDALAGWADSVDPDQPRLFAQALDAMRDGGAEIVERPLPLYRESTAVTNVVQLFEAHRIHRARLEREPERMTTSARIVLTAARVVDQDAYLRAVRLLGTVRDEYRAIFRDVDVMAVPTAHNVAPLLSALNPHRPLDPIDSVHTAPWSAAGLPAVAVPIGFTREGLPMSITVAGDAGAERGVLEVAHAFQLRTTHHELRPAVSKPARAVPRHRVQNASRETADGAEAEATERVEQAIDALLGDIARM